MLSMKSNGIVREIKNIDGVETLIFSGLEVKTQKEVFEVVADFDFKYRKFDEYTFDDYSVYKLYCCNEENLIFNIVRLSDIEVKELHRNQKISKILIENNLDSFDSVEFETKITISVDDIIHQTKDYVIFNVEDDLYVKDRETDSQDFDYKEWYIQKKASKKANHMFPGGSSLDRDALTKFFTENFSLLKEEFKSIVTSNSEEVGEFLTLDDDESILKVVGNFEEGHEDYIPNFKIDDKLIIVKQKFYNDGYFSEYYRYKILFYKIT